ncbi:Pyruvate/Phosphoenolpyruvate kinase-like domain containing protein [Tylopilus felleus]
MSRRETTLVRLRRSIRRGEAIVGGGARVGLSAKTQEAGGVDLVILYNSGRYRMADRGSLAGLMPYGDASGIMLEMARETLTVVKNTPVLAGICGTDPFRDMSRLLPEVKDSGFTGKMGMDYGKEVEMIRLAHEMDLLTTPYAFNVDEAERMTKAGADIIVAHMGLTTSGTIGAQITLALDKCVQRVRDNAEAVKRINPDVIVLCHGGPTATPGDAQYVIERVKDGHGFVGASSLERLPVEAAMKRRRRSSRFV